MNVRTVELGRSESSERAFIAGVYGWMCFGLVVTAVVALMVAFSEDLRRMILGQPKVIMGLIIGELVLVMALSWLIGRISSTVATVLFTLYAAMNGLTLSAVFVIYTLGSVATVFFVTAGTFGAMSVYGFTTKRDLTSIGNLCFMALIGLIIASVVNIFMRSPVVYWVTTYAGVLIFVGLTAYDTQRIKRIGAEVDAASEDGRKLAVMGALALYLDFINLFLRLLRIFGRRR
jgi:hypothetical protein